MKPLVSTRLFHRNSGSGRKAFGAARALAGAGRWWRSVSPRLVALQVLLSISVSGAAAPGGSAEPGGEKDEEPPPPPPAPVLARLGTPPDWSRLAPYQETITREEFRFLLEHNYACPPEAYRTNLLILPSQAIVLKQSNHPPAGGYSIRFAEDGQAAAKTANLRPWRAPWDFRPPLDPNLPLEGVRIAIDPGHIGGEYARREGRWYQIGDRTLPVMEGEMTLITARILKARLESFGAEVSLVREENAPVTSERPTDLHDEAAAMLRSESSRKDPFLPRGLIESTADRLFAVSSEIRARGKLVNETLKPDLVICLHFNAEAWGDPSDPDFVDRNHFHILINGCYSRAEIAEDDERFEMLIRLLQRTYQVEAELAGDVADSVARVTGLPPFEYDGTTAKRVTTNPYVWTRNLLASRIFECPVIFLEPYVMNHRDVHSRVQAGDYPGLRKVDRRYQRSIYEEYADGVTQGVVEYFTANRRPVR